MLAIVVLGMGVDYSLFLVRSYQRYGSEQHPSLGLVRMAVFLASASTMIGFGILVMADHYLLYSAGLVSLLGIGYSLLGAYLLLPPILRKYFHLDETRDVINPKGKTRFKRVLNRFAKVEAYPRMFARFKMMMDPMFLEIDQFFDNPKTIIDIGCGYGVPTAWILDQYPSAKIFGFDPDPERIALAKEAGPADDSCDITFLIEDAVTVEFQVVVLLLPSSAVQVMVVMPLG